MLNSSVFHKKCNAEYSNFCLWRVWRLSSMKQYWNTTTTKKQKRNVAMHPCMHLSTHLLLLDKNKNWKPTHGDPTEGKDSCKQNISWRTSIFGSSSTEGLIDVKLLGRLRLEPRWSIIHHRARRCSRDYLYINYLFIYNVCIKYDSRLEDIDLVYASVCYCDYMSKMRNARGRVQVTGISVVLASSQKAKIIIIIIITIITIIIIIIIGSDNNNTNSF